MANLSANQETSCPRELNALRAAQRRATTTPAKRPAHWSSYFWFCISLALGSSSCERKHPPEASESTQANASPSGEARTSVVSKKRRVIDVHVHLQASGVERLEQLMSRYDFHHVVNLSGGHPLGGLRRQLTVANESGKVTVFTTLAYEQAARPGYGERMAHLLRVAHQDGARGLKIAKVLGLGLRNSSGKLIAVDDPELDVVFKTAGELQMPVAIHTADPLAFWKRPDTNNERFAELSAHPGWSQFGRDVPTFDELYAQLERRIARHPQTTFISVHFGNCAEDPDRVARSLRKFPNLYIDTAARIPEMGRHSPARMREFFHEFQDRILYGSDLGVGPEPGPLFLGSSGPEPSTDRERELFFSASQRYFETDDKNFEHPTPIQGSWKISGVALSKEILDKIYYRNAARLLNIEPPSPSR